MGTSPLNGEPPSRAQPARVPKILLSSACGATATAVTIIGGAHGGSGLVLGLLGGPVVCLNAAIGPYDGLYGFLLIVAGTAVLYGLYGALATTCRLRSLLAAVVLIHAVSFGLLPLVKRSSPRWALYSGFRFGAHSVSTGLYYIIEATDAKSASPLILYWQGKPHPLSEVTRDSIAHAGASCALQPDGRTTVCALWDTEGSSVRFSFDQHGVLGQFEAKCASQTPCSFEVAEKSRGCKLHLPATNSDLEAAFGAALRHTRGD